MKNNITITNIGYNTVDELFIKLGNVRCILYYMVDTRTTGIEHKYYIELNPYTIYTKPRTRRVQRKYRISSAEYVILANMYGKESFHLGDIKLELRKNKLSKIC